MEHNYVDCFCLKRDPVLNPDPYFCKVCKNTYKVIDPREILCNLCGECMCPLGTHNEQIPHGLYKAQVDGGYDSTHLLDLNAYTFNLCEHCLRKIFIQCKIPVLVRDYFDRIEMNFSKDQEMYEYMEWDRLGLRHQAYIDKKCNVVKNCQNTALYTIIERNEIYSDNCCCEEHKLNYSNKLTQFIPDYLRAFL